MADYRQSREQPGRFASMDDDRLDVQPHDEDVLEEIELIGNLIIAASECTGPLPQTAIDTILGIAAQRRPA
jgi:hypothetical protein